jgi:hypothetical protein
MKQIRIGSVSIPLDSYVVGGTALLGIRESGKTYAAKGIAEQLLDYKIPIVVFDAIGVWRHLKVARPSAGGRGFKIVIAGGESADLPLTPASAPAIVRAAIAENIPLVIDLYDHKLSKADWRRIVQHCFRTLLYENKGLRHIFLEETAEYAPQKVMDGETYAEVEKLVRMGGNKSLGITLINQRAQEVNKAVLDLCENLVLMRQRGAHAIGALEKWIDKLEPDIAKTIATEMPHMEAGDAWVFSGSAETAKRTHTAHILSYHPDRRKPQTKATAPDRIADTVDFVSKLAGELKSLTAEAAANDPSTLKRRIAELERQVKAAPAKATAAVTDSATGRRHAAQLVKLTALIEELMKFVVTINAKDFTAKAGENVDGDALQKAIEAAVVRARQLIEQSMEARNRELQALQRDGGRLVARVQKLLESQDVKIDVDVKHNEPFTVAPTQRPAPAARKTNGSSSDIGSGGKRRMLTVLAQYPEGMHHGKLSILTGLSSRSGTWSTYLGELRTKGWVEGRDHLKVTEDGLQALGDWQPLPTGQQLIEYWRQRLGDSGKRKIFDVAVAAYPNAVVTEEVAEQTGLSARSGTWSTYLGELRTLGLITGRGEVRASEDLFS